MNSTINLKNLAPWLELKLYDKPKGPLAPLLNCPTMPTSSYKVSMHMIRPCDPQSNHYW